MVNRRSFDVRRVIRCADEFLEQEPPPRRRAAHLLIGDDFERTRGRGGGRAGSGEEEKSITEDKPAGRKDCSEHR